MKALVVGGSGLIGLSVVERMRGAGWDVVAPSHEQMPAGHEERVHAHMAIHKPSVVAYCAGIDKKVGTDWKSMLDANGYAAAEDVRYEVNGALTVCREAIKHGVRSLVLVTSLYGCVTPDPDLYDGPNKPVEYPMTKAALNALVRYVAVTYGPQGVRCNAVAPGGVNLTGDFAARVAARTPLRDCCTPEDVAEAVMFFAGARFISGQVLVVDGGYGVV